MTEIKKTAAATPDDTTFLDDTASKKISPSLPLWYSFFCASSVGMQLINKSIAINLRASNLTNMDNSLMLYQQIAAVVLNYFCCAIFPNSTTWKMLPFTLPQVKRLILPSTLFVFMLLCNFKALKTVHVATALVARNGCAFAIAFGDYLVFGAKFSTKSMLALLVTLSGSIIYGFNDLNYEPVGYMWLFWNSILFSCNQIYEKWAMGKATDQTALGVSTIKNSISIIALLIMMQYNNETVFTLTSTLNKLDSGIQMQMAISGIGCCALSICYMMLYKLSSATAITVGGNFNKVLSIIAASFLFSSSLGFMQSVGLAVSIGGSFCYSMESMRSKQDKSEKQKEKGA